MSEPEITIIIPTRNGMRYLQYAIDSILSQDEQNFELIVSDNHSDDGTSAYLATIADPRFRFIRPPTLLSMKAHFEFAIGAAQGTWVTTLGDDDGVMPFFFQYLRSLPLGSLNADAIVFRRAYYFWEGCGELYGDAVTIYQPFRQEEYKQNMWSIFLCVCSIINYAHLPQLYTTGLVRRRYMERVKAESNGIFFHGPAPDASSAVALALHARKHYRVEEPIFWTGTSPKSTGFSQSSSQEKARALEFDQLQRADQPDTRNEILPRPIGGQFDAAVLFYDSLVHHPSASAFWSSKLVRYFLFAGLIIKDAKNIGLIQTTHKSFKPWKARPFIAIVKMLGKRHLANEKKTQSAGDAFSIGSTDRMRYPTMREASAAALDCWLRLRSNRATD